MRVIGDKGSRPTDISETNNVHVPLNKTEVLTMISSNTSIEVTAQNSSQKDIVPKTQSIKHRNDRMFVITAVAFVCVFFIVTFKLIKKTRKPFLLNLSEEDARNMQES